MSTYSPYSGRLGDILDKVWTKYNAEKDFGKTDPLLNTDLLVSLCNACTTDIAQFDFWSKETALNAVSGQANYDLLTLVPDLVRVRDVFWDGTKMGKIRSYAGYKVLISGSSNSLYDKAYLQDGNTLYVWPTPTANATGIIEVYHSYLPADLGGISYLNAAAATNIGSGVVNIAATNHGFTAGDTVTIYSTVNYNGARVLQTGTDPNNLRILATYVAEAIPATAYAIGTKNEIPLTPPVSDMAYVYYCLKELASKDYMGQDYSDKLYNQFALQYRIHKARLVSQTTDLTQGMRPPR